MEIGAVSRLSKSECITFLDAIGIPFKTTWTTVELRQLLTDYKKENQGASKIMSRLAALRKGPLQEQIKEMGISTTGNETIAQLLLKARRYLESQEAPENLDSCILNYGKFKGHSYTSVYDGHPSYISWTRTTFQEDPLGVSPDLKRFYCWIERQQETATPGEAGSAGRANAETPPPKMKTEPKAGYPSSSRGPAAAAAAGTDPAKPEPPQWDGDPSTLQIFMKMAAEFPAILRRWEMDQILLRRRRLP